MYYYDYCNHLNIDEELYLPSLHQSTAKYQSCTLALYKLS